MLSLTGAMLPGVKQNSMLRQFSWQQFLMAAFALSLVWYAGLFLFSYRGRKKRDHSGKERDLFWDKRDVPVVRADDAASDAEEELMGKPRLPEGMSRVSSHELLFAGKNPEVAEWMNQGHQLGLIPDVIEELKEIFRVLEAEQGTKEDFFELFRLVRTKFPGIRGSALALLRLWVRCFPVTIS